MASTYSEILLVGRVTGKPELWTAPNGTRLANYWVAVDRLSRGGQKVTDYFQVTAKGGTAEAVARQLDEGSLCLVRGYPNIQEHEKLQVEAVKVKFVGRHRDEAAER
jgi:single-stranded DNA-binding protein